MSSGCALQRMVEELDPDRILTGPDLDGRFSHVWKTKEPIQAKAILLPRNTDEVALICGVCNEFGQRLVLHGGLTGLVGATVSAQEDLIMSLEKLDQIEEIDTLSQTMTVQAGVVLESIHNACHEMGLFFPLSFGAKGSAQIGGCIATNAGGTRVMRYGMTRNLILGLEVVLADGTIVSSLKKIIKDNSGYALNQLFIGSEGTIGVITRAVLKLHTKPESRNSAFVAFNDFDKVVKFLNYSRARLFGRLTAFELLWGNTYNALTAQNTIHPAPLDHGSAFYALIETLGMNQSEDQSEMEAVLEMALEDGLCLDAVLAHSTSDQERFWNIREDVGLLNQLGPFQQHFDISLSVENIDSYINNVTRFLTDLDGVLQVYSFGHLADGNIHFIVLKQDNGVDLEARINHIVYEPIVDLNGSVSAEHGIGLDKKRWLSFCRSESEIEVMSKIKKALDHKGILNPGRILDTRE